MIDMANIKAAPTARCRPPLALAMRPDHISPALLLLKVLGNKFVGLRAHYPACGTSLFDCKPGRLSNGKYAKDKTSDMIEDVRNKITAPKQPQQPVPEQGQNDRNVARRDYRAAKHAVWQAWQGVRANQPAGRPVQNGN